MDTAQYPRIGSKVSFIRQTNTGVEEGEGAIYAIVLDPVKRLMAHIETNQTHAENGKPVRHNVHLSCLNPTEEFKAQFKAMLDAVKSIGEEGNAKAGEIIAEYNKRVDTAQVALGDVVLFDA